MRALSPERPAGCRVSLPRELEAGRLRASEVWIAVSVAPRRFREVRAEHPQLPHPDLRGFEIAHLGWGVPGTFSEYKGARSYPRSRVTLPYTSCVMGIKTPPARTVRFEADLAP